MATLTSLSVLLKGDASGLVKATRVGLKAMHGFGKAAAKTVAFTGAAGVLGFGAAAAGLTALGNAARASIDAHAKNASRLGLTVSQTQALTVAATQSDVKIRSLNTAMASLAREAGKAVANGGAAADKFLELGISMEEVKAASPFELLQRVLGALGALESFTERARLGNNLFAESWLKLNPLIDAGAEGFADANTIFGRLGLGIGKNAEAVQTFNDKLDSLRQLGLAVRDKVFATLAPRMADFASGLFAMAAGFIEAQGGGEKFANMLATKLSAGVTGAVEKLGGMWEVLKRIIQGAQLFVDIIQGLGVAGAGLAAAIGAAAGGNFSGAFEVLRAIPGDVSAQFDGEEEQLSEARKQTSLLDTISKNLGPAFQ